MLIKMIIEPKAKKNIKLLFAKKKIKKEELN
jgi:hypothetical protein